MRAVSLEYSDYLNHLDFGLNMLHMQLFSLNKTLHEILFSTKLPGVTEDTQAARGRK